MNNKALLEIPEFTPLTQVLKCENCPKNSECKYYTVYTKYNCMQFLQKISRIFLPIEIIGFGAVFAFSLLHFQTFWKSALLLFFTFIFFVIFEILSDKVIYKICNISEQKRRIEYDEKVKKIKEDNEAIQKANLGITEELEKFLNYSKSMLNELTKFLDLLKNYDELKSEKGDRVLRKFDGVISELQILNNKLSNSNFESSYISTLYNVHLPKLLEYSKQFIELLSSKTTTENQIIKFSDLLEVFRIKIANHTQYIQDKAEDDFLIKITALNEDVMPEFDGSEVNSNG